MADWSSIVQSAISGLLTGGAGAASTLMAFFKDVKKRLDTVEKSIGVPGSAVEPRTGLYLLVGQLDESVRKATEDVKKLRRDLDNLENDPPEWFTRAINRIARPIHTGVDPDFEQRIERLLKQYSDRIKRAEEDFERARDDFESDLRKKYVDRESYDEDAARRAEEMRRIQESLSTANGFLRGVMAALGYLDSTPNPTPPQSPVHSLPRRK